jgi:hypothetical protein
VVFLIITILFPIFKALATPLATTTQSCNNNPPVKSMQVHIIVIAEFFFTQANLENVNEKVKEYKNHII